MLTDRLMRPSRAALACGLTAVFVGVGTASAATASARPPRAAGPGPWTR